MNKVKIITDSCADMGRELRDKYGVDYVRMSLNWSGSEKPASCDWDVFTAKELYDAMRDGVRITTNQVSVPEFEAVFGKYAAEGYDIIYIGCAGVLSGSVAVGAAVARTVIEAHPGIEIRCIDAKNSSGGEALLVMEAAKMAADGLAAGEIAERIEKLIPHVNQFVTVDSLTYLKRAGRVKGAAAFFGNLLGIKPIIISDAVGANVAIKKIKGRKPAIDECIASLKTALEDAPNGYPVSEQTIYIGHSDCRADADYIAERVKEVIKPKDVIINYIGPIIGASLGPAGVAVFGFGKAVTIEG